jgi:hypothetical protein
LTKKNSAQKQIKSNQKNLPPFFISLKVAQGAQEAPTKILEHSLIGKGKIDHEVLRAYHCGRVLLTIIPIHMEARTFSEKGRTFNLAQKR